MDNTWSFKTFQTNAKTTRKIFEDRNSVNKENCKTFARLFEAIKQKSKKNYTIVF